MFFLYAQDIVERARAILDILLQTYTKEEPNEITFSSVSSRLGKINYIYCERFVPFLRQTETPESWDLVLSFCIFPSHIATACHFSH